MAAVYDRLMKGSEEACLVQWRADLLRDLSGTVLEIGAGTGATLALYPQQVTRLVMCEPDPHMRRKLEQRRATSSTRWALSRGSSAADRIDIPQHDVRGKVLDSHFASHLRSRLPAPHDAKLSFRSFV